MAITGRNLGTTWASLGQYLDNSWAVLVHYLGNTNCALFGHYLCLTWTHDRQVLQRRWGNWILPSRYGVLLIFFWLNVTRTTLWGHLSVKTAFEACSWLFPWNWKQYQKLIEFSCITDFNIFPTNLVKLPIWIWRTQQVDWGNWLLGNHLKECFVLRIVPKSVPPPPLSVQFVLFVTICSKSLF